jgi:serine/threonine-protein kinase
VLIRSSRHDAGPFQHEIRVTARLQHPHILAVFDSGETAGHQFTMPHVDRDLHRGSGARMLPGGNPYRREAAQALAYAHSRA